MSNRQYGQYLSPRKATEKERVRKRGHVIEIHNAPAMSRGLEYNAVRGKKDGEAIRID